jgi:hypothetical protein
MFKDPQSTFLWFRARLAATTTGFSMWMAWMSLLIGTVVFSLAFAAENRAPQPGDAASGALLTESSATPVTDRLNPESNADLQTSPEDVPNNTQSEAPAPQAERLKSRSLGLGFEKFNPSEAISADNAVPFPIDI